MSKDRNRWSKARATATTSSITAFIPRSHDLLHQEPAEALLPGPLEVRRIGPVAAEPDLHDVLSTERALFDQTPEGRSVGQPHPVDGVGVVGVGVEVDQAKGVGLQRIRHRPHVRMCDGVVPAEDHRDRSRRGDLADRSPDRLVAAGLIAGHHLGVAEVHHGQDLERVHPHVEVRPGGRRPARHVGQPDGAGTEPGPRPVRHGFVDGRAHDGHVRPPQLGGVEHQGELGERGAARVGRLVGAVHLHGGILPAFRTRLNPGHPLRLPEAAPPPASAGPAAPRERGRPEGRPPGGRC